MRIHPRVSLLLWAALLLPTCGKIITEPAPQPLIVTPPCSHPASLLGADRRRYPDRIIDDYIVLLTYGSDVNKEGPRLASKYRFQIKETFISGAFIATLSPEIVAGLRCEPTVSSIEFSYTVGAPPPA